MLKPEIRDIPTRIVAHVASSSVDDLRHYLCGPLKGIGELVGTTRCFSRRETLGIAWAFAAGRSGLGLAAAFAALATPTPQLVDAIDTQDGVLTFWPRRGGGENGGYLVKVVVDAGAIVQNAAKRLDEALEAERRHQHGGPAFVPASGAHR